MEKTCLYIRKDRNDDYNAQKSENAQKLEEEAYCVNNGQLEPSTRTFRASAPRL